MAAPPQSQFQVPYPWIDDVSKRARDQIRRNFEELTAFLDSLPSVFVVVAGDGSGDYTSIKEAIEAETKITSLATAQSATMIWVKPYSAGYDDGGDGAVDIGDRRVVVYAPMPTHTDQPNPYQDWTSDGLTCPTGETGIVEFHGFSLITGATEDFLNGLGTTWAAFRNCIGNWGRGLFGTAATAHVLIYDSAFGTSPLFAAGTTATGPKTLRSYASSLLLRAASAPPSLTALSFVEIAGGTASISTGTLTTSNTGSGGQVLVTGAMLLGGVGNGAWSITSDTINITGCGGNEDTTTIDFSLAGDTASDYCTASLAGNSLGDSTITIGESIRASIHGTYRGLVLNGSETSGFVEIDMGSSGTAITIANGAAAGDNNFVIAAIQNDGGTAQAVSIGASCTGNVVLYTGSGFGTADVDSGSGNLINSIPGAPTGAAGGDLSGTYPNPSVVDDSHAHTTATLPATMTPRKASGLIGDGATLSLTFTHSLGTTQHSVTVLNDSTGEVVYPDITVGTNTDTFDYLVAPATNEHRVTVIG